MIKKGFDKGSWAPTQEFEPQNSVLSSRKFDSATFNLLFVISNTGY